MSSEFIAEAFDLDHWMIELQSALDAANRSESPSEVHGLVTGAITNHMFTGVQPVLFEILTGGKSAAKHAELDASFARLYRETSDVLFETDFEFIMLLPDESDSPEVRTQALAEWCQGYCLGLMHNDKLTIKQLPEECADIVNTIVEVSQATVSVDIDPEEDERALMEIQEYLKLAVHEVFNDVVELRKSGQQGSGVH